MKTRSCVSLPGLEDTAMQSNRNPGVTGMVVCKWHQYLQANCTWVTWKPSGATAEPSLGRSNAARMAALVPTRAPSLALQTLDWDSHSLPRRFLCLSSYLYPLASISPGRPDRPRASVNPSAALGLQPIGVVCGPAGCCINSSWSQLEPQTH